VGGEEPRTTEARIVAATHQPIERRVEEGAFREDLYFRLRVVEIRVPPLRERRDDIPMLADALLARIRRETRQPVRHISSAAMDLLMEHEWPGNVRELENALTRAAILARGAAIGPEHLSLLASAPVDWRAVRGAGAPAPATSPPPPAERDVTLDSAIARHVQKVLVQARGNKSETARLLEISRSRLQRLVEKFDLDVPDDGS
jgi:DNA-binding NtrC family response regulator